MPPSSGNYGRELRELLAGIGTPKASPLKPDSFQLEALNAIETQSPGSKHDFYFGFLKRASERFLPEATFRRRQNAKLQYAILAEAGVRGYVNLIWPHLLL